MKIKGEGISRRLRELRSQTTLTQQNIADILGIDRTAYTLYETGKNTPTIKACIKLSQLYGVTVGCVLGTEDLARPKDYLKVTDLKNNLMLSEETGTEVKKDESDLLAIYRTLPNEDKERLFTFASNLAHTVVGA